MKSNLIKSTISFQIYKLDYPSLSNTVLSHDADEFLWGSFHEINKLPCKFKYNI
jgi:hypothetical protein